MKHMFGTAAARLNNYAENSDQPTDNASVACAAFANETHTEISLLLPADQATLPT